MVPNPVAADPDFAEDEAAVCVGVEQAERYCAWVGGSLPSLEEWMVAARGRQAVRFSWGQDLPTCDQHPGAVVRGESGALEGCSSDVGALTVARHPAGASEFGMEDALLSPGELLAPSDSHFPSCREPSRACIVYGLAPGAIDSVEPVGEPAGDGQPTIRTSYSFRCAWESQP